MQVEPVVEARELSKEYRLGELMTLHGTVARARRAKLEVPTLDALQEVSFTVGRGECFGVVGSNGSGKSTLMQILSGITLPSGGMLRVRGRVLPLLEIGSGFHPELTGRENVVLSGTILGIPRKLVMERLDAVLDFAGLQAHAETPNKRYSNGMQARLSCAIAMMFPADVYIFDEVLAVLDDEFQRRCIAEIRDLVAAGRTVVFISHDADVVQQLCDRVMWLERGRVRTIGLPEQVLSDYAAAH